MEKSKPIRLATPLLLGGGSYLLPRRRRVQRWSDILRGIPSTLDCEDHDKKFFSYTGMPWYHTPIALLRYVIDLPVLDKIAPTLMFDDHTLL